MILNYSKRDQLSFMYCLSKTNLPFKAIPLNVWNNDYIYFTPHNKDYFDFIYKIYYNSGEGFSEQDSDSFEYIDLGNKYLLSFKLKKNVNKLRIDPTDIDGVSFQVVSIEGVSKEELIWDDFLFYNNKYISNSNDPKIIINKDMKKESKINIIMKIKKLEKKDFLNIISYAIEEEKNKEELRQEIEKILNSISWKITKPLRYLSSKIKNKN